MRRFLTLLSAILVLIVTASFTVEVQPEFPGGTTALYKWIGDNLEYPSVCDHAGTRRVIVKFKITETGEIEDAKILRGSHPALDKEALRVVNAMPKWKPGMMNGKPVKASYTLPIVFKLAEETDSTLIIKNNGADTANCISQDIFMTTRSFEQPEFVGGIKALYHWLEEHTNYPDKAAEDEVEGRVVIQFEVSETGDIEHVGVLHGCHPELDKEAVRVISNMPKWKPAHKNGQPVRAPYCFPITFKHAENTDSTTTVHNNSITQ